jgi:molecular chaperone GrpE (heat shock protein)
VTQEELGSASGQGPALGADPAQGSARLPDSEMGAAAEREEPGTGMAQPPDEPPTRAAQPESAVEAELARLADEVASLHLVLERHDPAERFSGALRQLTDELAQARRQELRPLYLDMILLLDRVENGLSAWRGTPAEEFVITVHDEIAEILARRGVTPMTTPDGWFDPQRQRAVKAVMTRNPEEDRRVVDRVRRGYECDGYILRAEEVVVSRYSDAVIEG